MSGALQRYRIMAFLVGTGLLILVVIGIPLQYGANTKAVVAVVGPIHGFLYIIYLAVAFDLARRSRFTILQLVGMIAAGLLPGLAFYVEHIVSKRVNAIIEEKKLAS